MKGGTLEHDGVHLPYDVCAGVSYNDVHADRDAALSTIIERYHEVARQCDAVVIVGSDYSSLKLTPRRLANEVRSDPADCDILQHSLY